jgi:arginine/lysine/ornithine decarboxylase
LDYSLHSLAGGFSDTNLKIIKDTPLSKGLSQASISLPYLASTQMAASPSASAVNVSSSRSSFQSQTTTSSAVFIVNALEKIAAAREARRNKQLKEAIQHALGTCQYYLFSIQWNFCTYKYLILDVYKNNEPVPDGQNRWVGNCFG